MDVHLEIFKKIANNDDQAYEILFKEYYRFLCSFAYGHTKERHTAEEIVEDFFVDLWKNRQEVVITKSVRSYFISSIHNRCLNYLQRDKNKFISTHDISNLIDKEGTVGDKLIAPQVPSLLTDELEQVLAGAIEKLPANCKEIFMLSRHHDLNYEEISQRLNVSVNTVKTQMKIALRKLREDLKDYLVTILFLLIFYSCSSLILFEN
jgi:RNA polymerase sigma-70 factor, ECF subfamily